MSITAVGQRLKPLPSALAWVILAAGLALAERAIAAEPIFENSASTAFGTELSPLDAALAAAGNDSTKADAEADFAETLTNTAPAATETAVPVLTVATDAPIQAVPATSSLDGALAQVTSLSELSDVAPGDWVYTALQRLVEEYGCLEGFPDRTYRGDRALARYEFAAGLNACLDVVVQLIGPDGDLDTIRRLQEEFAAELADIRGRVDIVEADIAELEANQFSTTTRLSGTVFAHLDGAFAGGDVTAEGLNVFAAGARDPITLAPGTREITDDPEITFSYLTWLNLDTSFTGSDRLTLQLAAGSGNAPANTFASAGLFNTFGVPFTLQQGGKAEDAVLLREAFYSFPVGDRLSIVIGPKINWYRHFDNNRFTFLVTGANTFNSSGGTQVNTLDRGSGVIAQLDITDWLDLRVGYLSEATEFIRRTSAAADPSRGIFGGTNMLTAQIGLYPTDELNLRFLYTRSELEANQSGLVGGALGEPLYGLADDGLGGPLDGATADTFLFNFDWLVMDWLGLFGRYSYGSTDLSAATPGREAGDVNAQALQLGVALPDLLKEGALATISYVRPFALLDGRRFLVSGGGDGGVQEELEISYRYPVTQNFAIVPSFYLIRNVNNFSDNPDIFVFNLQTQLFF
ncbi:iron uptake porin [Romeria aff. gracilis LEGE 07310]|uniref:Iron uptake porin n=1 Tax=Vasconcelosia minhoensis LEGE 07310 TaxID=915328 RepID=A0A8J7DB78_9CYAN|nr:iron uptake porin [Romeria gracilis]MBE9075983.1 iron uptake porin [Romeria aff. gracilis LEGE 07310]